MARRKDNGYFAFKMQQAREAYEEAEGLLECDAELRYVANSIYYAFYYPVLALLNRTVAEGVIQIVSISLFEKIFSGTGIINDRFFPLIRKAFDLKPKCTVTEPELLDRETLAELLEEALAFYRAVEAAGPRVEEMVKIGAGW